MHGRNPKGDNHSGKDHLQQAEDRLNRRDAPNNPGEAKGEELTHKLQMLQTDLTIQNDELRRAQEELDLSRQKYYELYDLAPVGYFTLDQRGQILECNLTGTETLGRERRFLIGHPFSEYICEGKKPYFDLLKNVLTSETRYSCSVCLNHSLQNDKVYVKLDGIMWQKDGKRFIRLTVSDINDLELVKRKLEDSEQRYRLLIELSPSAIIVHDGKRIMLANRAATTLFGARSPKELIGSSLLERMQPERRDWLESESQRLLAAGGYTRAEQFEMLRQDGKSVPVEGASAFVMYGVPAIQMALRDLSQIRRAEQRNSAIIQTTIDGFYTVDITGRFIEINDAYCRMIGYSREELRKMSIRDIEANESTQEVIIHIERIRRNGADRFETRQRRKDGTIIEVEVSVQYMEEQGDGNFVAFVHDITERRASQKRIHESLAEKKLLLREIHHRVKNNMQIISSLLNLQARQITDPTLQAMFQNARDRIKSMALIHEGLYHTEELAHINFTEYIRNLAEFLVQSYRAKPDEIVVNIEADPVELTIDAAVPLGLIANELITNALNHALIPQQTGTLNITLSSRNDNVTLKVSDNGTGFPKDLDFRNTKSLGLRLVNLLTQQLEGAVEMASDNGCSFTITFKPSNIKSHGFE